MRRRINYAYPAEKCGRIFRRLPQHAEEIIGECCLISRATGHSGFGGRLVVERVQGATQKRIPMSEPIDPTGTDDFVDVQGLALHYHKIDRVGGGGIPVIFTHGGGPGSTGWNNFLYNAAAFAQRYVCYFYEAPLFGQSARVVTEGPTFSWHAEKFLGFMDALGIQKAHVVNQSFGSGIAIKSATLAPERFGHLVLTGGQPVFNCFAEPMRSGRPAVHHYFFGEGGPTKEKLRWIIENMEFFDKTKVTDYNVDARYAQAHDPKLVDVLAKPNARGTPESLIGEFSKVESPALCVHGLYDWFGGIDMPMLMVNQFKNARLYVMPHGAHHLQTECADEYNSVVLNFLPKP